MEEFDKDTLVRHGRFGTGRVRVQDGATVMVRFEHGLEECLASELERLEGLRERLSRGSFDPPLPTVSRVLADCILSVNDTWGVFSASRIALLPHQLWVCKRVLESWPTRWLIADDVGLGKTIEAGLILTPLLASGRVRRLLILAPASLVGQWQLRLREMFDIRVSTHAPGVDTPTTDYWNTHDRIVASAHTLRLDTNGRWDRLLDAEPWDMVIVDEAHHLNLDESRGRTLAYQLVEHMEERGRVRSMLLFTGTPHRGKDFGFLSLLRLLKPGDFDPQRPLEEQLGRLRGVMIRNNKQRVTDMKGERLFTPIRQQRETYTYSPEEAEFYAKLTEFITSGRAYAAGLGQRQQRTVMLVLITMQKLASSSVAAVRNALVTRLSTLTGEHDRITHASRELEQLQELGEADDTADLDAIALLEERVMEGLNHALRINREEVSGLRELIAAADEVHEETKIRRILDAIEESFGGRSVLLFTEYKATQALVMSGLQARFGDGCVTFINGDGFLDGVRDSRGRVGRVREERLRAADRFNRGEVRFLVSTEAAGEGIDLQENCSALIHVDLPWNPMRLHQRVGRLSRYGQTEPVDVVTVRNPDTVESRIWECLDRKLDRITLAFQGAMDDPEDMRQLVVGMASPRILADAFAEAPRGLTGARLQDWFDSRTATFGGSDAVRTVRTLVGHVARFDFGEVADQIPKVDLPDLIPFFKAFLTSLGRRSQQADPSRLSFKTPDEWMDDFTVADRYDLVFDRVKRPVGEDIAGVGLRVVNRALRAATERPESLAILGDLDGPLAIFALRDRVTGGEGGVRKVVVGARHGPRGWTLLRDWEVLLLLNPIADRPRSGAFESNPDTIPDLERKLEEAQAFVKAGVDGLDLPFRMPVVEPVTMLVPG